MDLQALSSLEYLDLSRNLITDILPGLFLSMASLKGLDLSINNIRKVRAFIKVSCQDVFRHREFLLDRR